MVSCASRRRSRNVRAILSTLEHIFACLALVQFLDTRCTSAFWTCFSWKSERISEVEPCELVDFLELWTSQSSTLNVVANAAENGSRGSILWERRWSSDSWHCNELWAGESWDSCCSRIRLPWVCWNFPDQIPHSVKVQSFGCLWKVESITLCMFVCRTLSVLCPSHSLRSRPRLEGELSIMILSVHHANKQVCEPATISQLRNSFVSRDFDKQARSLKSSVFFEWNSSYMSLHLHRCMKWTLSRSWRYATDTDERAQFPLCPKINWIISHISWVQVSMFRKVWENLETIWGLGSLQWRGV